MGLKVRLDHMLVADASPSPSWDGSPSEEETLMMKRERFTPLNPSRILQPDERLVLGSSS
jgi:hypothetical protein